MTFTRRGFVTWCGTRPPWFAYHDACALCREPDSTWPSVRDGAHAGRIGTSTITLRRFAS